MFNACHTQGGMTKNSDLFNYSYSPVDPRVGKGSDNCRLFTLNTNVYHYINKKQTQNEQNAIYQGGGIQVNCSLQINL